MEAIIVHVVQYPDRTNLMMRYKCPATGKQIARSTGTTKQRDAEKAAAKWEAELREGRYSKSSRMAWSEFREYYEDATMETQATSTVLNYASTFNAFETTCRPERLADLTTAKVTAFAAELRKDRTRTVGSGDHAEVVTYKLSEASVARHLRHLKAIARWAHRQDLLPKLPKFDMPKRSSGAHRMKGRAITGEEFDRMIAATAGVVSDDAAESWKFLLRGLWTSGLRLGEAMALRWDHEQGGVSVVLDGKHSCLAFDGESQKSGKAAMVPLAPEAVELLSPRAKRTGHVFNVRTKRNEVMARDTVKASKIISKIGAAAGVVTDVEKGRTATAHDLRRAFGSRWSKRVMPATLKAIMRHEDIQTTMTYYVDQGARTTAAELWSAVGNISGNTESSKAAEHQKTP